MTERMTDAGAGINGFLVGVSGDGLYNLLFLFLIIGIVGLIGYAIGHRIKKGVGGK